MTIVVALLCFSVLGAAYVALQADARAKVALKEIRALRRALSQPDGPSEETPGEKDLLWGDPNWIAAARKKAGWR